MSSQKQTEADLIEIEIFYFGMVAHLYLQGKEKLGVKSLPDGFGYSSFVMWIAQLDLDELQNAKAFFFDRWTFETNNPVDRALFKIFDGWKTFRRAENHFCSQSK